MLSPPDPKHSSTFHRQLAGEGKKRNEVVLFILDTHATRLCFSLSPIKRTIKSFSSFGLEKLSVFQKLPESELQFKCILCIPHVLFAFLHILMHAQV